MLDKGAGTGGRRARTGKERGTKRMGWMGTRLMAKGGLTEGQNGNEDKKRARKMAKERAGRRG